MRELSLFSGAGGGLLGTHCLLGWRTVGYVEIDEYCQRILEQRITDGIFDDAPIYGDIRLFISQGFAKLYSGMVDVLTAGFPCQPFSAAGKRRGAEDERNMWPYVVECIRQIRPRYVFLENVPGLLANKKTKVSIQWVDHTLFGRERKRVEEVFGLPSYFGHILRDLAESGYDCRWRILSAAELGAPHLRRRLWIVADAQSERRNHGLSPNLESTGREGNSSRNGGALLAEPSRERCGETRANIGRSEKWVAGIRETVSDAQRIVGQAGNESTGWEAGTNSAGGRTRSEFCDAPVQGLPDGKPEALGGIAERAALLQPQRSDWWDVEPDVGRVANGVADRVDRLIALGNGQVPIVAAAAWRLLMED